MSASNVFNFVATEELNVVNDFKLIPPTLTSPKEPVDVDEPVTLPAIVKLDAISTAPSISTTSKFVVPSTSKSPLKSTLSVTVRSPSFNVREPLILSEPVMLWISSEESPNMVEPLVNTMEAEVTSV